MTPSVTRVFDLATNASNILSYNGIAASEEMHRLKAKAVRRTKLHTQTGIVAKYGPISVQDARLRVAKDDHNRLAAQADEQRRISRRDTKDEGHYLRCWVRDVRAIVRSSLLGFKQERHRGQWAKIDRQIHLSSNQWMAQKYALHRQLQHRGKPQNNWQGTVNWPLDYDPEVVKEAVNFFILSIRDRAVGRRQTIREASEIVVIYDNVIEDSIGEFLAPKYEIDS